MAEFKLFVPLFPAALRSRFEDFGGDVERVLISACLLGRSVRYDGKSLSVTDPVLKQWVDQGCVISVCPEVEAGMGVPRAPAEISKGDGNRVLAGTALIVEKNGKDVTAYFKKGAHIALDLCRNYNIKVAVLAECSPSCGSSVIYDGRFRGKKIPGIGVTTALLKNNGIEVFNQHNTNSANKALLRRIR